MRCRIVFVLLASTLATSCGSPPATRETPPPASQTETPLKEFPYTPGLDVASMDRSADPCADFYQYSCGGWMTNNPVPADQSRWNVYAKLSDDNRRFLWGVLQDAANRRENRTAVEAQIGDYFAACMDEAAVDRRGITPIQPTLDDINAFTSTDQIARWLGEAHLAVQGSGMLFGFGSEQDAKNSQETIAAAYQGGISLPDRDYYLKEDAKSKEIRDKYRSHLTRMLQLAGDSAASAEAGAKSIMEIETALAAASLSRVERRDPYKNYHKLTFDNLQSRTPRFKWSDYRAAAGIPNVRDLNVQHVPFFEALNTQLHTRSLDDWKTYLRWHVMRATAPLLSKPFVEENFDFFSRTLRGVEKDQPRWKRCVRYVDSDLGEALGQAYVAKVFSPELKGRTEKMTKQIEQAMEDDINSLSWLNAATKKEALRKLHAIVNKIGYPDRWRDYSSVKIARDDFFGNAERGTIFESRRQLGKIGKPLDRGEWHMTPPTVNAYYDPQMNDINFPAGVLQPPLYDPKMDEAPNYGNTGGTIGHELTHGFDDEGRQFDAEGNLRDWWTKEDASEFQRRASCIADQYAQYVIIDDIKINSKLTLGEDVADLGGLILAWMAWKAQTAGQTLRPHEGLTPEQRFFVGYAQWACENTRPEQQRVSAATDPHSPGRYRVNGLVVNMPEFRQAFSCTPGKPLYKEHVCRVW